MAIAFMTTLIMLLLITYYTTQKHLHIFERCFVLFVVILVYLSFLSIVSVNLNLWEISKKPSHLIAFRLNGVVFVPLTFLWAMNAWEAVKGQIFRSAILFISFLMLLFLGDFILRLYDVYQYNANWNVWMVIIVWVSIFIFTLFLQNGYKHLLRKEGMIH
jgi:hypothetical protein